MRAHGDLSKNISGLFHSNGDLVGKINVLSTYPHE